MNRPWDDVLAVLASIVAHESGKRTGKQPWIRMTQFFSDEAGAGIEFVRRDHP